MKFAVVLREDFEDGGLIATVPTIPGVVGQGESVEEAVEDARGSLYFTLESMSEQGEELPQGDEAATELNIELAAGA